jgi:hypothetical protein
VSLLPQAAAGRGAYRANPADAGDGPTIDGTARRL